MSEYWVSQGRKMCSYCKCWIADNKASINFHEQGKNHKENVKKKLDELRKKGLDDAKKQKREESDLEKIEKAALASLKKDLAANPSIAGAYGIPEAKVEAVKQAIDIKVKESSSKNPVPQKQKVKPKGNQQPTQLQSSSHEDESQYYSGEWHTAVNEEGYTYYWNTVTNETSWYPPDAAENASVTSAAESTELSSTAEEAAASEQPYKEPSVRKRKSAYGAWQVIKTNTEVVPDLQLPHDSTNYDVDAVDIPLPDTELKEEADQQQVLKEKKFKEKEVTLSTKTNNSAPVAFKKRKFGANRQARKKGEEDV